MFYFFFKMSIVYSNRINLLRFFRVQRALHGICGAAVVLGSVRVVVECMVGPIRRRKVAWTEKRIWPWLPRVIDNAE